MGWSDDACLLDGAIYKNVPVIFDECGNVIEPATCFLLELVTEGKSGLSVEKYALHIVDFYRFLNNANQLPTRALQIARDHEPPLTISTFADAELRLYRNTIKERKNRDDEPVNPNPHIDCVVRFLKWAQEYQFIVDRIGITRDDEAPFPIRLVADGRGRPYWPSREKTRRKTRAPIPTKSDVELLYQRLSHRKNQDLAERDCLLAEWAEETGPRRMEVLQLTEEHLPDAATVEKAIAAGETLPIKIVGKGQHKRNLMVSPELINRTRRFIAKERKRIFKASKRVRDPGFIFISQRTGTQMNETYLSRIISAGFGSGKTRRLTLHRLRARYASRMAVSLLEEQQTKGGLASLREETILFKLAELLGHKNLASLDYYLDLAYTECTAEQRLLIQEWRQLHAK